MGGLIDGWLNGVVIPSQYLNGILTPSYSRDKMLNENNKLPL
jgi:hypothetical protein